MQPVYLPIRSFGDFIITASMIKDNFLKKVPVILPLYLADLFESIKGNDYFELTGNISYTNQPAFFELYKVKDLQNLRRLLVDMRTLQKFVIKEQQYLLDYRSKRLFFAGGHFAWPPADKNIYHGKHELLAALGLAKQPAPALIKIEPPQSGGVKKVLILPDSRISSKSIDEDLIQRLLNNCNSMDFQIARYSGKPAQVDGQSCYSNFDQLIKLICSSDLVISAESLPYHLANFLHKPHFVIYNQSRHFKSSFMTPFMEQNHFYSTFTGDNQAGVIAKVEQLLF